MARNFLTGLRLVNLPSDPPTGSEGELYYNTVTDKVRLYSNGAWIDVVAASSGSLFNVDAIAYPDYIAFDTTPELSSTTPGTMSWNDGDGSLDLILKGGNVTIPLGQEICSLVYNAEDTTLNPGEAVYMFGAQGQRVSVKRASNAADVTSSKTFGLVAESIPAGAEGFVMVHGIVKNLNTNGYNEGDQLYVGSTPGTLTSTKPAGPQHGVFIGVVVKKNASSGRIFVKAQNGYELDELHDVRITSPLTNDILSYSSASNIWINESILDIIIGVGGEGSGIDADLLDGQHGSYYAPTASPTFTGTVTIPTLSLTQADTSTAASHYIVEIGSDGLLRPKTLANVRTEIVTTAAVNSASATILGTITSGIWNGTAIDAARGGTGQTTYAVGDILYASAATTLTKLSAVATGNALISGGLTTAPSWGKIGLTTHVSGTLPIANGGTNATATPTQGGIAYGTGSAYAFTSAGTAGQVLTSNGASAPTWQAASGGTTIEPFFLSGM